jgi:hypothetical protein
VEFAIHPIPKPQFNPDRQSKAYPIRNNLDQATPIPQLQPRSLSCSLLPLNLAAGGYEGSLNARTVCQILENAFQEVGHELQTS